MPALFYLFIYLFDSQGGWIIDYIPHWRKNKFQHKQEENHVHMQMRF